MKTFNHVIQNDCILPFISANRMAEIAGCYPDTTGTLNMGTRHADMSRPMKVATMGLRKGDAVTVTVDGPSEVEMFDVLCTYFGDAM